MTTAGRVPRFVGLAMDATRARLSFGEHHVSERVEWAMAAVIFAVAVVVAWLLVRELRVAPWAFNNAAESTAASVMPREAVSVPLLVLAAGREVHIGEARADAVASLESLPLLKRTEEAGRLGAREVRSYQGVTLVLEPFELAGDPRVVAIYLQ